MRAANFTVSSMHGVLVADAIHFPAVGWSNVSIMNNIQTLIIDLAPQHGSSITACVRFLLPHAPELLTNISTLLAEQPHPVLHWRGLRLRHRPHPEPVRCRLDVRPPVRHLHGLLPDTFRHSPLRPRMEGEATGAAASRRGISCESIKTACGACTFNTGTNL